MNKQQRTVKEFLMGAHCIDLSIQCKLEQVQSLSELAVQANTTISDMPGSPNRNIHRMEDVIIKIADLQSEIGQDIDRLLVVKRQILECINQVEDREGRMVLEERYLRQSKWEEIAAATNYSMRQIFRIHDDALRQITIPTTWQ